MKLIDKDALLAEIEKLKGKVNDDSSYCNGWQHALRILELSLYHFEVKEVDLEKEIQALWSLNQKSADSLFIPMNYNGLREIAKHFYELGMAASNKAQKGEEA